MLGYKPSRFVLPIVVLVGILLYQFILNGKPVPAAAPELPAPTPAVEIIEYVPGQQQLWIESQGVVEPALKIKLIAQIAGRVEWVSTIHIVD